MPRAARFSFAGDGEREESSSTIVFAGGDADASAEADTTAGVTVVDVGSLVTGIALATASPVWDTVTESGVGRVPGCAVMGDGV